MSTPSPAAVAVRRALLSRRLSQAQVTARIGIPTSSLASFLRGDRQSIAPRHIEPLCDLLGLSISVFTGLPDDPPGEPPGEPLPPPIITIPLYRILMGCGSEPEPTFEELADTTHISVPAPLLGLSVNPSCLRAVHASGDSMAPSIMSGAIVILDVSPDAIASIADGAIYAFALAGDLRIKRLVRTARGDLIIRSDNPAYPPETIPQSELENTPLVLIGRVRAALNLFSA